MIGFLHWRATPQQLDPVIARALYPLIGWGAAGALAYAILRTIAAADDITDPVFAVAAILLVVVATFILLVVTDPVRTPVRVSGFAAVVTVAVLASVSSTLGSWGDTDLLWDNWGPLVVGVCILSFAEFRPGRSLALATVCAAVVLGAVAAVETAATPSSTSWFTAAVIAATPVVLFGVGASVFSYTMSLGLSQAAEAAAREQSGLSLRVRIRLREMLRESGRDALSVDLVPFLEDVLERGSVTEADAAHARRMSAVLRSVIITDMGLPWLQRLARAHPDDLVVHDDGALADQFSMEQKVALRALLAALLASRAEQLAAQSASDAGEDAAAVPSPPLDPPHVRVNGIGRHRSVFVRTPYTGTEAGVRARFGTAITVMNSVFGRSSTTIVDGELRMLFAYETESSIPS